MTDSTHPVHSHAPERDPACVLAAELDRALPPHSDRLPPAGPNGDPDALLDAAVRLARGPHPVMNPALKAALAIQLTDQAQLVQAQAAVPAPRPARRIMTATRWLAAALIVALAALVILVTSVHGLPGPSTAPDGAAQHAARTVAGDTVVFVAETSQLPDVDASFIILAR